MRTGALTISFALIAALATTAGAQPAPGEAAPPAGPPAPADPNAPTDPEPPPSKPDLPPVPPAPPAPEPAKTTLTPTLSGFVDATYNVNFNRPVDGNTPLHTYTGRSNSFLLNTAHVELNGSDEHLSYSLQIDGGTDAVIDSGGSYFDVQEAYAAYTASSGLGFKVGKFVTYNGIEVIESPSNPTISRGFLFNMAEPFTHTGGVVTYKANDQIDVAIGLVNGWDLVVDNNGMKTIVAKLGVTLPSLLLTVSALAGPEKASNNDDWRTTLDVTGDFKADKLDLWFQANYGMEQKTAPDGGAGSWFGLGVQPVYHLEDDLSIGGRVELFDDLDGTRSGVNALGRKQMLINISAAPAYTITPHLTLRGELRVDLSTGRDAGVPAPFVTTKGDANSAQVIALGEAIVSF